MSCLLKIYAVFAFIILIDTIQSSPLFQGFSVQKGFEVNLKPFQFKPISFFKEKWSPFGRFGIRKGIQKRDLRASAIEKLPLRPTVVSPAPVFEHFDEDGPEERKESIQGSASEIQPAPVAIKPISSNLIRIPLTESFKPPTEGLYTSIGRNPPVKLTPNPIIEEVYGELPPRPVGPVPEPVEVSPQPKPIIPVAVQPVSPFPLQSIATVSLRPENTIESRPVNQVMFQPAGLSPGQAQSPVSQQVVPLITPPPRTPNNALPVATLSEIPPTDGPLVRGSKVALYFGNVLLQLVSQFLTNARLQFSQFKQSPLPQIPPPSVPATE